MSAWFWLFIILTIIGAGLAAAWLMVRRRRRGAEGIGPMPGAVPGAVFGLAVSCLVISCFTTVGTRDIGITTSFGRPVGHLSNGIHLKAPWENVSTLDGAIQVDTYNEVTDQGTCSAGNDKGAMAIRIGNQSTACVEVTIKWRIDQADSDSLFQDYHTMDNIRDSLVTRNLKQSLNEVLGGFNPLNEIAKTPGQGSSPNVAVFGRQAADVLRREIGAQINVIDVIIPIIHFDKSTQDKLNAYQAEVANTRIQEQREQTTLAQAKANRNLAKSVSNDPNVLVSKCFDLLGEMILSKQSIPPGFSCWQVASLPQVVIPAGGGGGSSGAQTP